MKRYKVTMTQEFTSTAIVEAESLEDARSIYYAELGWDVPEEFTWPLEYEEIEEQS